MLQVTVDATQFSTQPQVSERVHYEQNAILNGTAFARLFREITSAPAMAEGKVARENHNSHAWSTIIHHHTAPAEDETLTERDAKDILEELQEAMNRACELGLVLKLLPHEVDAIRKTYPAPRECLLQVILAFLRQVEPRPTWRVIVDALRSPAVNLTALAERVRAAHFPDSTATRPPPPATGESVTRQSISEHIVM